MDSIQLSRLQIYDGHRRISRRSVAAIWIFRRNFAYQSYRSIFILPFLRDSPFTRKDIRLYILSENQYNECDTASRVSTGSPQRVTINRVSKYEEIRGRDRVDRQARFLKKIADARQWRRTEDGREERYLGKRSAIYGHPSMSRVAVVRDPDCGVIPTCIAAMRNSGPQWFLHPRFSSTLILLLFDSTSILTMVVKFIAIVRQEISRRLLPFPFLSHSNPIRSLI